MYLLIAVSWGLEFEYMNIKVVANIQCPAGKVRSLGSSVIGHSTSPLRCLSQNLPHDSLEQITMSK